MFEKIFIEEHLIDHPQVNHILKAYPQSEKTFIKDIEDVFNRVKKPYLQKRKSLQLFLGEKKGTLVKPAPDAYGLSGEPHYYFVHAYNCIYECNYCYLQGYFHSPDIVLFLNHEAIGKEIIRLLESNLPSKSWFHAGEFSDSLALTHLTHEIPFYFNLFKNLPHAYLEFRTKSVNIKEILKEKPLKNIITSFSLSPKERAKKSDLKTPTIEARLNAIGTLYENQFPIAIHFDPIIYEDNFINSYLVLIEELIQKIPPHAIAYISLGVVRFTKDVYHQVQKNYPTSDLLAQEFVKSFDNKIRYSRPMRMWMLLKIKDLLMQKGFLEKQIYLCMEEPGE
jgi:spore photoproduct lyase